MDPLIRTEDEQQLVDFAAVLADSLAPDAEAYDRSGQFVASQLRRLQDAGYSALTVPAEYGGRGIGLYPLLLAQERLAEGDAAAALVIGWHLAITLGIANTNAWPTPIFRQFCESVVGGQALINACGTEPETGNPARGGRPATTAAKVPGGYALYGKKTWATGSPYLTHMLITAYLVDEDTVGEFLVLKGSAGLWIEESWDSMSMRATGSHTLILEDVFVPEALLLDVIRLGERSRRSIDGSGWLLHIPATYLGIANAARRYILQFSREYAPNSLGRPIMHVPHVKEKLGRIEVLRQTARTFLYDMARRYDEASPERRSEMRSDIALAKLVATNSAVEIVDIAMRIAGGHGLLRNAPLERYYRDVRAGLHNPPIDDITIRSLAERALEER